LKQDLQSPNLALHFADLPLILISRDLSIDEARLGSWNKRSAVIADAIDLLQFRDPGFVVAPRANWRGLDTLAEIAGIHNYG
jgi:hypothetical protein